VIRRILVTLVSVSFLLAGLAIAQPPSGGDEDPPVRLKKKFRPEGAEKPQAEPKKEEKPQEPPKDPKKENDPKKEKDPKKPDDLGDPIDSDMDEGEVLNRVGKNMRSSEDRLDRAELNDSTRQVQDDIIKDLDDLINQEKNGGGGDDQKQNQDQNNQQNQNDQQKQAGKQGKDSQTKIGMGSRKRGLKGSQARRNQGGKKQNGQGNDPQQAKAGQQPGGGNQPMGQKPGDQQANAGQQPGNQGEGTKPNTGAGPSPVGGMGGQSSGQESSKLAEIYKEEWGHLPEALRAPMDAHSREMFMAKYNDLIKQYYITVAEKSRKKD